MAHPAAPPLRERPIIVLAATIVIMVTKGQLGRAKAATAAGSG
jgi:hypothetical protein